jgi:hypothetical protein
MLDEMRLVAQGGGYDLGEIITFAVVVLLPMLGGLGKWLRDRSAKTAEGAEAEQEKMASAPAEARPVPAPARPIPGRNDDAARPPEIVLAEPAPARTPAAPPRIPRWGRLRIPSAPAPGDELPEWVPLRPIRPPARAEPGPRARPTPKPPPSADPTGLKREQASRTTVRPPVKEDWTSLSRPELRRAIVLYEILGPPVALREVSGQTPFDRR